MQKSSLPCHLSTILFSYEPTTSLVNVVYKNKKNDNILKSTILWDTSNLIQYLLVYEVIRVLIVLTISACYLTASKLNLKFTSIMVT